MTGAADTAFMAMAFGLARRGLGTTAPNPAVGCVLVQGGRVVGRGWTQPGGRPHAEVEALRRAGPAAAGATAYVSLEPCAHHGATGPCADALIAAGVARVVAAVEDPDPRVSGAGLGRLRAAGVAVTAPFLADAAAVINAGFFLRIHQHRPLVTWKVATTLDGRIAAAGGASRWITGPAARRRAHLMRAEADAILVGSGTVLADDPELTCRLPGLAARSPVRVVADSRLGLPLESKLVQGARQVPLWVLCRPDADPARRQALAAAGAEIVAVAAGADGGLDPGAMLAVLAARGMTRLLLEGGGRLAASFLRADLVDRVAWFRAPLVMGGDGIAAIAALGVIEPGAAPRLRADGIEAVGEDLLETYRRDA